MSYTPFKQWRFPHLQGAGGHAFGIRINKGIVAGATGPQRYSGSIYTASQIIQLDPNFLPLHIGEWERTRHDIGGCPAVPKIELTFQDSLWFTGVSNALPVSYNLSSDFSSLMDEIFDDPTIVYEVWLDDYFNGSLFEIWFVGDVDYGAIPILHKGVVGEGTSSVTRYQEYTITANFTIERLVGDHNKDTTDPYTGEIVTPGSIFHFAYGNHSFRPTGNALPLWQSTAPGSGNSPQHLPLFPGNASSYGAGNTGYGNTGSAPSGVVLAYNWPQVPDNIVSWSIADLCNFIADYGGMKASIGADYFMFDMYSQQFSGTTGRFSELLIALSNTFEDYQGIFVNLNFLLGNGIPFTGSYDTFDSIVLAQSGYSATNDMQIQGSFLYYDTNTRNIPIGTVAFPTVYFKSDNPIAAGPVTFVSNNDSFSGLHVINGDNVTFNGTATLITSGVYYLELAGAFGGATVYLGGFVNTNGSGYLVPAGYPMAGETIAANGIKICGTSPILYQWPCTIGMDADVLTLAAWIATQTGTWIDSVIDATGNVTMTWRARRPVQGATPFAFKYLSFDTTTLDPLIIGSNEDPSEITQTAVTVQGGGLSYTAGSDTNNAASVTIHWACHKQGEYTASDGDVFYNPNNVNALCIEQWWNTQLTSHGDAFQNQCYTSTADAKVSRPDPNSGSGWDGSGQGDWKFTARTAIPTMEGWSGGSMLYWKTSFVESVFDFGTGNEWNPSGWQGAGYSAIQSPHPTGAALVGIAAILPAGLTPPLDEMCGGYFNTPYAYAQLAYQDIVGSNGQKLILIQDYIGCRGDDGYLQSLRPGLIFTTLLRGKVRTLLLHNVKQSVLENKCTLQWEEIPTDGSGNFTWNSMLPSASQTGSGSGGTSIGAGGGSSSGGGGTSTAINVWSTTSASLTASTNNLAATLTTPNVYLQLSATSAYDLTGIIPSTNCVFLKIRNTGTNIVTLKNFDSGSTAANQFSIAGGDFPLLAGQTAEFIYDSLWVCCGTY